MVKTKQESLYTFQASGMCEQDPQPLWQLLVVSEEDHNFDWHRPGAIPIKCSSLSDTWAMPSSPNPSPWSPVLSQSSPWSLGNSKTHHIFATTSIIGWRSCSDLTNSTHNFFSSFSSPIWISCLTSSLWTDFNAMVVNATLRRVMKCSSICMCSR